MKANRTLDRPAIFLGAPRSGTTIISEAVMCHQALAFPSTYQDKFVAFPEINLLRNLFDNRMWRVQGEKKQLNYVSSLNRYVFKPAECYRMWDYITGPSINFSRGFLCGQTANADRLRFIRDYFTRMVRFQRRARLSLKITGPSRIRYLQSIFPDALFIVLRRRRIPTISSLLKVEFWRRRGYETLLWHGAYTQEELAWAREHKSEPELITAMQLKRIDDITLFECEMFSPIHIVIHYEEFIQDPVGQVRRILDFLDLAEDTACIKHVSAERIQNRNKSDEDYFSKDQLRKIQDVFSADSDIDFLYMRSDKLSGSLTNGPSELQRNPKG